MKVLVAGGSGFLGKPLCDHLVSRGHEVLVLTRSPRPGHRTGPARDVPWNPEHAAEGKWRDELEGAGAVVNLAGAGIADRRWTTARKRLLRSSRIAPTQALAEAVTRASRPPAVFVQGSAVGYYGATLDEVTFDEASPAGDDFLGRLCQEWEQAALPAGRAGCRLAVVRTGIALAASGGALAEMDRPFRYFVGGRIASGRQVLSWIHRDDWVALVAWALETDTALGVLNATAPEPATNAEFSRALAAALQRPSWLPVPAFALRLMFGELADSVLCQGQRVLPNRTQELGFTFSHPVLADALADVYGARR